MGFAPPIKTYQHFINHVFNRSNQLSTAHCQFINQTKWSYSSMLTWFSTEYRL